MIWVICDISFSLTWPARKYKACKIHQRHILYSLIHFITNSACKVYTWKPAVHTKYTPGNQQCIQSIYLETSSAYKVHTWKPAVHTNYTPENQQCMQSIHLETSSACKVYTWKPAVHTKYTPGNQQCRSTLQLRTSCTAALHCRSLPAYFKLLHILNHSSSLIHLYPSLKTVEWSTEWVGLFWD